MASPKVWGKYFWTTLHIAALGYPDQPTAEDMAVYKRFYEEFGKTLPCKKCAVNYARHLQEIPIDKSLASKGKLFAWTVDLHNIVNRDTGKAEWTVDYAKEFYINGSYNDCRLSYEETALRTDIWRMILILMIIINIIIVIYALYMLWR